MNQVSARIQDRRWFVALVLTFLALLIINPLGYIGGGRDDWQYLTAARCWVENGPCLPQTHWEGRWPVFAPIAGLFALFGESRLILGLWPLACSIAAILLLVVVGNRLMGRPIGWLAGIVLLVTPAFSVQILEPSVEALELAFELAGVALVMSWANNRRSTSALAAGLAFGLAFQVRETALVAAAFTAIYVLRFKPTPRDLVAAAAGFAAPLAIELIVYWQWAGDPFLRRELSLAHTQIPSSELRVPIDHQSPFFNRHYIANWRIEPGVHIHWLVDPYVNLFINGLAGFTLALTPLLLWVGRSLIDADKRRKAWAAYILAMIYAAVLIYALAMDPKARIMLAPLSLVAICFSVAVIGLWQAGRRLLAMVAIIAHSAIGIWGLWVHQRTDIIEGPAARWIALHPGQVEIDPNTRRHLALVPSAEALPGLESDRPLLLHNSVGSCKVWLAKVGFSSSVEIVAEQPLSRISYLNPGLGGSLCLFHYRHPFTAESIREAIRRSRVDGPFIMNPRIYAGRAHAVRS